MFWTIELCVKYSNWGHWTPVSLDIWDKMRKSGWKQYRRRRRRRKRGRGRGESNYVSHLNWFLRGSFVHPQFWICLSSVPWLLGSYSSLKSNPCQNNWSCKPSDIQFHETIPNFNHFTHTHYQIGDETGIRGSN